MSSSSGTSEPWGLSGVPASVPAAIGTPSRSAIWKLSAVAVAHRQRLAHRELGDAGGHAALDDGVRRDERRHQRHAVAGHARGRAPR